MGTKQKKSAVELEVKCDFSEVSRRWAHEWGKLDGELQQWTAVVTTDDPDDLTEEEQERLRRGRVQAYQEINRLMDRRNELMAMVVVDVPREWLTKDAPEEIDWSNVENLLDYVKGSHNEDLMRGVTLARMREAKNSQRTTSTA